jgi:amino acid transporter
MSYVIIQACIAILILVGFESVTSMGEEAKNPKRDIPIAVLASLGIQGLVCYLVEYFAANYFLNSGYTMTTAAGSSAPIGDMMYIVGTWLFGSVAAGKAFMMIQAFTVFLALIGTTLSCVSTGARVTYAMGRDEEVPSHFGLLHGKHLTPHKTIWTLAGLSAVIGIICIVGAFWGPAAPSDDTLKSLPKNGWYSIGVPATHDIAAGRPNTMLAMTLVSNFGTFVLYMLTCLTAMIAFKEHHTFREVKHSVIPMFGFVANLVCMLFYLIGPFTVDGMSWKESYIALGIAALWGIYGLRYFFKSSKAKGKSVWIDEAPAAVPPSGTASPSVAVAPTGVASPSPN